MSGFLVIVASVLSEVIFRPGSLGRFMRPCFQTMSPREPGRLNEDVYCLLLRTAYWASDYDLRRAVG